MARPKRATEQRRAAWAKRNQSAVPDHAVAIDNAAATAAAPVAVASTDAVHADDSGVRAHSEKGAAVPIAMAHASADTTDFTERQLKRMLPEPELLNLTATATSSNERDRRLYLQRKRQRLLSSRDFAKKATASQGSDSDSSELSGDGESSADNAAPPEPNAADGAQRKRQKLDFAAEVSNDNAQDDNAASGEEELTFDEEPLPGFEMFGPNLEERLEMEDFPLLPDLTPDEHDDDASNNEDNTQQNVDRCDQVDDVGANFYNPDAIDLAPEEYNPDIELY